MPVSEVAVQRDRAQRALWDRTAAVAGALNAAHAELVEITTELVAGRHWGDGGFRSVEHYLVVRAGLSPAHARDVAAVARRRAELPVVAAAVAAGELSLDQAAVVAHHVPAAYQRSVGQMAKHMSVPQLRRAVSRHAFAAPSVQDDDGGADDGGATGEESADGVQQDGQRGGVPGGSEAVRRACARPELSMGYDADGRFQLRYSAPATVGALVEQAVREAKDALFLRTRTQSGSGTPDPDAAGVAVAGTKGPGGVGCPGGGTPERPTTGAGPRPTYADGFELLAHRSLAAAGDDGAGSRADRYRVYLHLSTDGAWVNGRGAVPRVLLDRFLANGIVQPLWETAGTPVSVGRAMRILPDRARRLVTDRDRGCRFPGCTTTRFLEVHHLHAWADGGNTDLANQVSLCPFHHDAATRGDIHLTGDPARPDGLTVTTHHGLHLAGPPPDASPGAPGAHDRAVGGAGAASERPPRTPPPRTPPTAAPSRRPALAPTAYHPPTGEPARWADIELTPDRDLRPRAPAPV